MISILWLIAISVEMCFDSDLFVFSDLKYNYDRLLIYIFQKNQFQIFLAAFEYAIIALRCKLQINYELSNSRFQNEGYLWT